MGINTSPGGQDEGGCQHSLLYDFLICARREGSQK